MPEGRRQAYLAALELTQWVTRQSLPGGQPAEPLGYEAFIEDMPAALPDDVSYQPDSSREAPPAVQHVAEPEPVTTYQQPVAVANAVGAEPQAGAGSGSTVAEPRFGFLLKRYEGWQAVIAVGDIPDLSAHEHQLLMQIEAALGLDGNVRSIPFRFPFNNNPGIPRDHQAAVEAVGMFMRHAGQRGGRLLLLGEHLAAFMPESAGPLAVGASLTELLAEPLRKRVLWQAICGVPS